MRAPWRRVSALGAAAFLLLSQPGFADTQTEDEAKEYWSNDDWTIFGNSEGTCRGLTTATKRSTGAELIAAVSYNAKEPLATLSFKTPETTSLADEGEVKLSILFTDNAGENADDGWGERTFQYSKASNGYWFTSYFSTAENSNQLLKDVARSSRVAVFTERNNLVAGAVLDGSAAMVAKLKECAFSRSGLNPNDPFLK